MLKLTSDMGFNFNPLILKMSNFYGTYLLSHLFLHNPFTKIIYFFLKKNFHYNVFSLKI